jgi:gelsolin
LEGGVDTGFSHVEAKTFTANLYQIKGTEKGLSMTQRPLTKSSLNGGDSFILFCDPSKVWVWHGSQANPDEKAKANVVSEKMCTQGTTVTIQQEDGEEEYPDFWTTLGGTDGEVAPPQDGDELVKEFTPVLFRITGGGNVVKIAEADKIRRFGSVALKLDRAFLDDDDVFLLDAGWEVFLWVGNGSDKEEKVAGLSKADEYLKKTVRTANLPLTIVKSGWESPDFWQFFKA